MKWHNNDGSTFWLWIMRHVPKKWLYWAVIQAWCYATMKWPDKSPDEITWDNVCNMLHERERQE